MGWHRRKRDKIDIQTKDEKDGWVPKPIFLETFNPEKGHIYQRYWKPFRDGTMPPHRQFVRALSTDNPYVPQAYIERIKRSSKATIERLLHGNFDYDDDPSKIFNYDKISDLFSNIHVQGGQRYLSGDIAGKGKDRTVLYVCDGLKVIHIYSEEVTDQDDLYKKILELKQTYAIPTSNIILDYDGIDASIVDRLKCKGFQANATAFTTKEEEQQGLKANFKNLRSQCWFKLADKVNDALIHISSTDPTIQEKSPKSLT